MECIIILGLLMAIYVVYKSKKETDKVIAAVKKHTDESKRIINSLKEK